ncbi:MAG: hypothetical protein ACR2F9_08770 [Longimicrobiaceae bacterium]
MAEGGGDRRDEDRRRKDRRRTDRRTPTPLWRRPWALVAYGVAGALLAVLLFRGFGGDEDGAAPAGKLVDVPVIPVADTLTPRADRNAPPVEAREPADFERLTLEGQQMVGRRVHTVLSCAPPAPIALSKVSSVPPVIAQLTTPQARVLAADCKWGRGDAASRPDFLLLVPPSLAEDFAGAPVAAGDFVARRRLNAEVEWIGRSDALALRTAGVLRAVSPTP